MTSPSVVATTKKSVAQPTSAIMTTSTPAHMSPKHHRLPQRQNLISSHAIHCNYQNPPGKATILQQAPPCNQSNVHMDPQNITNPIPMSQIVQVFKNHLKSIFH